MSKQNIQSLKKDIEKTLRSHQTFLHPTTHQNLSNEFEGLQAGRKKKMLQNFQSKLNQFTPEINSETRRNKIQKEQRQMKNLKDQLHHEINDKKTYVVQGLFRVLGTQRSESSQPRLINGVEYWLMSRTEYLLQKTVPGMKNKSTLAKMRKAFPNQFNHANHDVYDNPKVTEFIRTCDEPIHQ